MNPTDKLATAGFDASEYIKDNFEAFDRIAVLLLNRKRAETVQRITASEKAASPDFQAWLRFKNASGADIYIGMNPLKPDASTRTKDDIANIRHVYLDLDHDGTAALETLQNSALVPKPNHVLDTSPGKHQVVWRVEGVTLDEAEALQRAMVNEFGGDPAATDATRVLRLPGFANKKYEHNFYVRAHAQSKETYRLRDFNLRTDSQEAPRQRDAESSPRRSADRTELSQSEHDWAYAKRALARGDDVQEIIRRIADFRAADKPNPEYYARHTVENAQAAMLRPKADDESPEIGSPRVKEIGVDH